MKVLLLLTHTYRSWLYGHFITEFAAAWTSLIEAVLEVVRTLLTPARLLIKQPIMVKKLKPNAKKKTKLSQNA